MYSISHNSFAASFKTPHKLPIKPDDLISIRLDGAIIFEGIVQLVGEYSFRLVNGLDFIPAFEIHKG